MASKHDLAARILAMPLRNGLLTAGQQTTIEETALWKADNYTAGFDGMLQRRPGLKKWAQRLVESSLKGSQLLLATYDFTDVLLDASKWTPNIDGANHFFSQRAGSFRFTWARGSDAVSSYMYNNGTRNGSATEWSYRTVLRTIGLPDADGTVGSTVDAPESMHLRIDGGNTTGISLAFASEGLYYQEAGASRWQLIADTLVLVNGGWHVFEVRRDGTDVRIYIDEVLTATILSNLFDAWVGTKSLYIRMEARSGITDPFVMDFGAMYFTQDDDSPWTDLTIDAVTDFRHSTKGGSPRSTLVCGAGDVVWRDDGQTGVWLALHRRGRSRTHFSGFQNSLVWSDYNVVGADKLRQWDGSNEVVGLSESPPVQFTTEHKQRLWAAGDTKNPLRLYFTGDRQPNLWWNPNETDLEEQLNIQEQAGFLQLPSKRGDRITALFGDYYGTLIVFTRYGIWRVRGDGPLSFSVEALHQDTGCESATGVVQVGNDLWYLSRQGVHTLSGIQEFGDIGVSYKSAQIQSLWTPNPSSVVRVSKEFLYNSHLNYNPTQGLLYMAVPIQGRQWAEHVYVYNTNTERWYGPWTIECRAMENIELGKPLTEVMMHGGTAGIASYTQLSPKSQPAGEFTSTLQSAYLNGRSIDPRMVGLSKTWKRLRIYVLPRGNWDFTVTWHADGDPVDGGPETKNQNVYNAHTLSNDFKLDTAPDGRLVSREEMGYVEIMLDKRSRSLWFKIEHTADGEDLVIQGFEVEFTVHGYEEDTK